MNERYYNILAAVDGSPQAHQALMEAVEAARRNNARLYIAQVINSSGLLLNSATPIAQIIEEEKKAALKLLEEEFAGIDYYNKQLITCVGSPKKALCFDLPEVYKIDLIYIGATGKGRLERMLVGSTTDYVVNNAPCDVMVVR
ncbi:MAG: universal stress protein [Enterococcus sp.]|uniref:universal stress protein n=1 Tax=Enterococcus raffinosus TaxID=71452 RepID=UPI001C0FE4FC|nr:universal stress protein [Enterococcus raffinosus]MBU5363334.1 universal stress protein [Enterococcus raffinosus]